MIFETTYNAYKIVLKPDLTKDILENFDGMKLLVYIENEAFITYFTNLRNLLLLLSVISCLVYIRGYKRLSPEMLTFEHKFLYYSSFGLVLSNNPLHLIFSSVYWDNLIWNFFQTSQYVLTLIFLISTCDRIIKEPLEVDSRVLSRKLVILGVTMFSCCFLFFLLFVLKIEIKIHLIQLILMNSLFQTFLLLAWIAVHIKIYSQILGRLFQVLRKWDFVLQRHQFLLFFSLSFFLFYCIAFIAKAIFTQIIIMNLYMIVLQMAWMAPSNEQTFQTFLDENESEGQEKEYREAELDLEQENDVSIEMVHEV